MSPFVKLAPLSEKLPRVFKDSPNKSAIGTEVTNLGALIESYAIYLFNDRIPESHMTEVQIREQLEFIKKLSKSSNIDSSDFQPFITAWKRLMTNMPKTRDKFATLPPDIRERQYALLKNAGTGLQGIGYAMYHLGNKA